MSHPTRRPHPRPPRKPAPPRSLATWDRMVATGGHARLAIAVRAIAGGGGLEEAWKTADAADRCGVGWRRHDFTAAFMAACADDPDVDPMACGWPSARDDDDPDPGRALVPWSRVVDGIRHVAPDMLDETALAHVAVGADLQRAEKTGSDAAAMAAIREAAHTLPSGWIRGAVVGMPWTTALETAMERPFWRRLVAAAMDVDAPSEDDLVLLRLAWGSGGPRPCPLGMRRIAAWSRGTAHETLMMQAWAALGPGDPAAGPLRDAMLAMVERHVDDIGGAGATAMHVARDAMRPGPDRGRILATWAAIWSGPAGDRWRSPGNPLGMVEPVITMILERDIPASGSDRGWLAEAVQGHGGHLLAGPHAMRLLAAMSGAETA